MADRTKTMRLPEGVLDAGTRKADSLGLTFTEYVILLICRDTGLDLDAKAALMAAAYTYVTATVDARNFPLDVTRLIFRHIRDDGELRALYDAATRDAAGKLDTERKWVVNRQMGKAIRVWLGAEKKGRNDGPLDDDELIDSHALLAPSDGDH